MSKHYIGPHFLPEIKEETFLFPGEEQVEEIGRCVCATAVTSVTIVTDCDGCDSCDGCVCVTTVTTVTTVHNCDD